MRSDDSDLINATEVIRCVYLARLLERAGNPEAAQRWQAKVDRWLKKHMGSADREGASTRSFGAPWISPEPTQTGEFPSF